MESGGSGGVFDKSSWISIFCKRGVEMRNQVLRKLVFLGIAALVSTPAAGTEAGSTYAGGQFAMLDYDVDGVSSFNPTGLIGRVGHFVADYVAIEGRVGFGLSDDSITVQGVRVTGELENLFGAYVVGHLPIEGAFSPYGLLGFTSAKARLELPDFGISETDTDSGFTWGLGVDIRVNPQVSINGEYVRYLDESEYDFSALSFGVNFWF